jgi:hypothetical protein
MSRVATIIIVGLCFLAGCSKPPQSPKVTTTASKPRIYIAKNFVVTDPNQIIALEQALEKFQPMENQYFIIPIEPQPGVDYKIIASKPNPNIDYKILNLMQNCDKRLKELLNQKYQDNPNIPQDDVFLVP